MRLSTFPYAPAVLEEQSAPELLGEVTVPSGVLVVVDAGLLWIWDGSRPEDLPETVDFRVEGPDAEEAGRRFDRSWHPHYWYDVPRDAADDARQRFADFVASEGLAAELVEVRGGVPHRRRIDLALEYGGRFASVEFFGVRAPVVAAVPTDRSLPVYGFRMQEEELSDRWRWITLEIGDGETARDEEAGVVAVDEARLMFADADALQHWRHDEPLDGRADYVFWGRDAADAAALHRAPELAPGEYGWVDLPVEETVDRGAAVEASREREGWTFAVDFRPHSHHHRVLREMRSAATGSGVIEVAGAKMCAFFTSWGDGSFPIRADLDDAGRLLRLRLDLGSDDTIARLRRLGIA